MNSALAYRPEEEAMQRVIRTRELMVRGIIWIGVTALVAINAATLWANR
jgi:hypothetical protein